MSGDKSMGIVQKTHFERKEVEKTRRNIEGSTREKVSRFHFEKIFKR